MSISLSRTITHSLSTLAVAVLSVASLPAVAQELQPQSSPWGVYVGGNLGVGVAQWNCGTSCNRTAFSGKVFGGKRLTPGLAAELNYMIFGGMDRSNDNALAAATGLSAEHRRTRAWTAGINWEVELLEGFTNQLRAGWAFKRAERQLTRVNGSTYSYNDYTSAPYVGAGLAMQLTRDVKLQSGLDYIIDGHNSLYLLSVGATVEF